VLARVDFYPAAGEDLGAAAVARAFAPSEACLRAQLITKSESR